MKAERIIFILADHSHYGIVSNNSVFYDGQLNKMTFNQPCDHPIRETALDTRESFIVQAPAGSGKTTLLTKRLLRLLAEVEQRPEECLAITFTRKAAGEMRDRILAALEFAASHPAPGLESPEYQTWFLANNLLKRDQLSGWNLLKNPSRLRIQTVDSLCASITRQMPILSQFGAAPVIVEDPSPLYAEAATDLLLSLKSDDPSDLNESGDSRDTQDLQYSIAILLKHLDNNLETAERLLAEMLSFREQWLPHIGLTASIQGARGLLEKGLQTAIRDILHKLVDTIPHDISTGADEILALAKYAAEELQNLQLDSPILACRNLSSRLQPEKLSDQMESGMQSNQLQPENVFSKSLWQWPGNNSEDLLMWQGLAELLLTENYSYRKTVTQNQGFKAQSQARNKEDKILCQTMKQRMQDLLKALNAYPNFREALEDLRSAPAAKYSENEWEIINALVKILPTLVGHLWLVFQAKGQVDFTEVLLAASRALGDPDEPSDLSLRLDNQIRHILVDEFQDISIPQLKLLQQLMVAWEPGEGRSVFLVGDPQQSIYRFRQAEVGLFLQVRQQGIGAIRLKALTLTANFRSSPKVVAWVNQFFSKTFPLRNEIGTGAIAYSPSVAALSETTVPTTVESIESIAIKEVTEESEAGILLDTVMKARQQDPEGSMALLIRSRHHLKTLIPILKEAGISYQGVEIEPLKHKAILQDLLSLTKALLHLGDRVAWFSLLRSPYCGLSLTDLWILANHEPELPLWWSLKSFRELTTLSSDAIHKLTQIVPYLDNALHERDRTPLSVWIRSIWEQLKKNSIVSSENNENESGEDFQIQETFFAILEEKGYSSDFYDTRLLERRLDFLYAQATQTDPNAIQIMTIHKAKGLEFDTVIVAGVGRKARSDTEKLLLWESRVSLLEKPYLILAPIKPATKVESSIYNYLKKENKKRALFEDQRLLYVAATRAKKRLYWLRHNVAAENDMKY